MDKKRQAEIALSIIKHSLDHPGVKLGLATPYQQLWTAEALGLPPEEVQEFSDILQFAKKTSPQLPSWSEPWGEEKVA